MPMRICIDCGVAFHPRSARDDRCPRHRHAHSQELAGRARAKGLAVGGSRVPQRVRLAVLERDGWVCRYCRKPANTVDHVVPYERGGLSTEENLVACCAHCNSAKGTLSAEEFVRRLGQ